MSRDSRPARPRALPGMPPRRPAATPRRRPAPGARRPSAHSRPRPAPQPARLGEGEQRRHRQDSLTSSGQGGLRATQLCAGALWRPRPRPHFPSAARRAPSAPPPPFGPPEVRSGVSLSTRPGPREHCGARLPRAAGGGRARACASTSWSGILGRRRRRHGLAGGRRRRHGKQSPRG